MKFLPLRFFCLFFIGTSMGFGLHTLFYEHGTQDRYYLPMSTNEKYDLREEVRGMFYHGYDSYMRYAFPWDELNPMACTGRGPDVVNRGNININDVLGDYALTLVDTLDTIAVMGNASEFQRAVQLVIDRVNFDKDNIVQVFEVTIRVLGALLSAHLLIVDKRKPFGDLRPPGYANELLFLAHDLANRCLAAFDESPTGIPYPRIHLSSGTVPNGSRSDTCTAGAGSLLLELGLLSRLLGDPVFENNARRAVYQLWQRRHPDTGLMGNVIDVRSGEWQSTMSGVGAGIDSFFEYLLKSYIAFGDAGQLEMFEESYAALKRFLRRGRTRCCDSFDDDRHHPIYVNAHMNNGFTANSWVDSLQASFAALQVLSGDVEEAVCSHALYYALWRRYQSLPERFDWQSGQVSVAFYPLRPELAESTYLLYRATKNAFYLHVGREMVESLNKYMRTSCGFATLHSVHTKELEDRMESFFLSETLKYLYLLFDEDNPLNKAGENDVLFTTEGHVIPLSAVRRNYNSMLLPSIDMEEQQPSLKPPRCPKVTARRRHFLPISSAQLERLFAYVGANITRETS